MLSIAFLVAALALVVIAGAVLRTRRPDTQLRMPHFGSRHGDMVDWTLEWRRALKSLENQDPAPRTARRS